MSVYRYELTEMRREKASDIKTLEDVYSVKSDVADIKNMLHRTQQGGVSDIKSPPVVRKKGMTAAVVVKFHREDNLKKPVKTVKQVKHATHIMNPLAKVFDKTNTDHQSNRKQVSVRQNRGTVFGTRSLKGGSKLAGIPRTLDVFVGRCDPGVTCKDITDHCAEIGKTTVNCERILTKSDIYVSFKLTVNADDRDSILIPDVWPNGVLVRKFYGPKINKVNRPKVSTSNSS
jgi:hypothetical protein